MTDLQIFEHEMFGQLEVVMIDDKEFFPAIDVALKLGYSKPHDAITKHCTSMGTTFRGVTDSLGRQQEKKFINEGNLYRLIIRSRLKEAQKFERWVFEEVIPSIRKHSGYLTPEKVEEALLNPDTLIRLATDLKDERAKRIAAELTAQKLKPKAEYYDAILSNPGLVTTEQFAKDYGMSAQKMNKTLNELGIQYKRSKQWFLYRKYDGKGYVHSETFPITRSDGTPDVTMYTKWTQKGRLFVYEFLKERGIVPMIEQEQLRLIK